MCYTRSTRKIFLLQFDIDDPLYIALSILQKVLNLYYKAQMFIYIPLAKRSSIIFTYKRTSQQKNNMFPRSVYRIVNTYISIRHSTLNKCAPRGHSYRITLEYSTPPPDFVFMANRMEANTIRRDHLSCDTSVPLNTIQLILYCRQRR